MVFKCRSIALSVACGEGVVRQEAGFMGTKKIAFQIMHFPRYSFSSEEKKNKTPKKGYNIKGVLYLPSPIFTNFFSHEKSTFLSNSTPLDRILYLGASWCVFF